jgi:hypothetical protein
VDFVRGFLNPNSMQPACFRSQDREAKRRVLICMFYVNHRVHVHVHKPTIVAAMSCEPFPSSHVFPSSTETNQQAYCDRRRLRRGSGHRRLATFDILALDPRFLARPFMSLVASGAPRTHFERQRLQDNHLASDARRHLFVQDRAHNHDVRHWITVVRTGQSSQVEEAGRSKRRSANLSEVPLLIRILRDTKERARWRKLAGSLVTTSQDYWPSIGLAYLDDRRNFPASVQDRR